MARKWSKAAASAFALVGVFGCCQLLGSSAATAQSQAVTQRVIVVLKNQESRVPATKGLLTRRRNVIRSSQRGISSELSASGARDVHAYTLINALSATVSPAAESALKSNPAVSEVIPDQLIQLGPLQTSSGTATGTPVSPPAGACAPPGQVQLDPQAIETIHADSQNGSPDTARSLGITGKGVTAAYLADGLDTNNPDFIRPNGQHVFVDYKDFTGNGTSAPTAGEEAFGDSSSIAAQGREVYDVSHYDDLPLNRPCKIRIEGVAPGASMVGLVVFNPDGSGFNSSIIQAVDYAVTVDHVNVINESFGSNFYPDDTASFDLIKQADDAAVAAGTTVVVSSGDAGVTSTIGTPATDPNLISAGATTTYRLDAQDGYGGARFPGVTGWLDNNISSFSSGGFAESGRTIDVVAPGELNWSLCTPDPTQYSECVDPAGNPTPVLQFGGTSESAPLTSGVAVLVIQAYRKTHGGATPSPAVVKQIITSTAEDIGAPADQQGGGMIDAYKAVLAAESYRAPASTPAPVGESFVTSSPQLNATDAPGTPETLGDTVTNAGKRRQTISVSARALGPYRQVKTTKVNLSDSGSQHITDWNGINDNYEPVRFKVPQGQNRLSVSIAFQNASATDLNARVRLTVVDPTGKLAAYSVPQGDGNFGNVQITDPDPGTWTAYVFSRDSADGGTTGPVVFGAEVASYTSFGHVSPQTLTLDPGSSANVALHVSTPSTPGDVAGAIVLSSNAGPGFARTDTVPVTLRSLIPKGATSFTQVLTGGNGRSPATGEAFYYQLDVPSGAPELNADVKLADNPSNAFGAWLISPSGEALAYGTNQLPSSSAPGFTDEIGGQLHVVNPAQGAWTLIVNFAPTVSGTALSDPFTVSTSETAVSASAPQLPDSASVQLTPGQASTYNVNVTNAGSGPDAYFLDARLPSTTSEALSSFTSATTSEPLSGSSSIPEYLVPSHTTSFQQTATASGSAPIQFDTSSPAGDPDLASSTGTTATESFSANPIAQGVWAMDPEGVGPFGSSAGPTQTVNTTMSVVTKAFDPAVSSPTGDLWETADNPSLLSSIAPVLVPAGQSTTIPVTITPSGSPGTVVKGTLYVDDISDVLFEFFQVPNGNDVAAIPYEYTIK